VLLCGSALLRAQQPGTQIEIIPGSPTTDDSISVRVSGIWRNGCIPALTGVSIAADSIRIDTANPNIICTQAVTPWSITGSIGKLPAGVYQVAVIHSDAAEPGVELARLSFTVAQATGDLIFPIVVNGVPGASGVHYQTSFTLLNRGSAGVNGKLEIYSDTSEPGAVFCGPQSPSASATEPTLQPGERLSLSSSADLAFVNGWARLSSDKPDALVAGAEIALIAADPVPCAALENRPSTEILASTPVQAIRAAREFRFPVTIGHNRQSAIAVVNPSTADITVRVTILDATGQSARLEVPSSFEMTLRPLERVSKMFLQFASAGSPLGESARIPEVFQGSVVVTSDSPMAAAVLQILFPEGKFESVAAYSSAR
jgi:hypothetical protein